MSVLYIALAYAYPMIPFLWTPVLMEQYIGRYSTFILTSEQRTIKDHF